MATPPAVLCSGYSQSCPHTNLSSSTQKNGAVEFRGTELDASGVRIAIKGRGRASKERGFLTATITFRNDAGVILSRFPVAFVKQPVSYLEELRDLKERVMDSLAAAQKK